MIDEPKIGCFEKVAKSRVAKELLKAILKYNKGTADGVETTKARDMVIELANARRASKIYGGGYLEPGVVPPSKNGDAYRSFLTGNELPHDPLARRIVISNELPVRTLQTPSPVDGYMDVPEDILSSLRGRYIDSLRSIGVTRREAVKNAEEFIGDRYLSSQHTKDPAVREYYSRFFRRNRPSVGDNTPDVRHVISAMGLHNVPVFRFRSNHRWSGELPSTFDSRHIGDTTSQGAVVLDGRKGYDSAKLFAADDPGAILEHELGHTWMDVNGASSKARNRMARRLAVELRKAQRAGGFNRPEFRVPTFRDIMNDINVASRITGIDSPRRITLTSKTGSNANLLQHDFRGLQEAAATYVPAKLRGAKSAIMRHGLDVPVENIPGFESMSPELKRVATHIYLNYPILRWS